MLATILASTMVGAPFAYNSATSTETVVKVEPKLIEFGNPAGDPILIPGTRFNVTVKIYNVTDLYGFDLKFRWNTTFLQYVTHSVSVPRDSYPDGVLWNPIMPLMNEVNTTAGTYWAAYTSMAPAPSFNGTGTVFTMTFEVIKQPYDYETGGPGVDPIGIILGFSSTDLAPRVSENPIVPIAHMVEPATVRIWEKLSELPPYPILKVMPTKVENMPMYNTFNIDIWLLGVNQSYDVANFSITLNFNSTLIEANDISEGSWPKSYAEDSIDILKQINNATGTATYALELVPPKKPNAPTTGILFTVTFQVIYESLQYPPPSCELTLGPAEIFDRNIGSISPITENGTYIAYRPPPIAKFTWSPSGNILPRGETITFNASESYHPLGGKITLYSWDFGDNTKKNATDPIIMHMYTKTGNFSVVLNITDYGGFWDYTSAKLYIVEPPPKPYLTVDPTYIKFGPYSPQVVGQQFNISIYIKNLDAAWNLTNVKFSLSYNTTLIDIIGDLANVTIMQDRWSGPNNVIVVRQPSALGKVTITLTRTRGAPPNGTVSVATIRFTVKYRGIYPAVDMCSLILSDIELTGPMGEIPTEPPIHGQVVIESLSSPVIKVEPSLIEYHENAVDKQFTVAVKIINVTNLYGFDLRFRWNTTVLEYVGHSVHIPRNTYTDGVLYDPTLPIANSVNQTTGTYWISYASMHPAWSFNGTGTVFTMTFKVKYHPKQPEPTINVTLELYATELADNSANPIPHTREQGMVTLYQILQSPAEAPPTYIVPYAAVGVVAIAIIAIYFTKIRKSKDLKSSHPTS
jgi:hypothetical protein